MIVVLVAAVSAACGFQLQGAFEAPAGMQKIYISTVEQYSLFRRAFEDKLLAAGVELTEFPGDTTAIFTISFDETAQRVLSVSARNVPTEYEVFYSIAYSLDMGTTNLLPQQDLTLTRHSIVVDGHAAPMSYLGPLSVM